VCTKWRYVALKYMFLFKSALVITASEIINPFRHPLPTLQAVSTILPTRRRARPICQMSFVPSTFVRSSQPHFNLISFRTWSHLFLKHLPTAVNFHTATHFSTLGMFSFNIWSMWVNTLRRILLVSVTLEAYYWIKNESLATSSNPESVKIGIS
jgi:hypothetical protein